MSKRFRITTMADNMAFPPKLVPAAPSRSRGRRVRQQRRVRAQRTTILNEYVNINDDFGFLIWHPARRTMNPKSKDQVFISKMQKLCYIAKSNVLRFLKGDIYISFSNGVFIKCHLLTFFHFQQMKETTNLPKIKILLCKEVRVNFCNTLYLGRVTWVYVVHRYRRGTLLLV